jgi:hypothetical protein
MSLKILPKSYHKYIAPAAIVLSVGVLALLIARLTSKKLTSKQLVEYINQLQAVLTEVIMLAEQIQASSAVVGGTTNRLRILSYTVGDTITELCDQKIPAQLIDPMLEVVKIGYRLQADTTQLTLLALDHDQHQLRKVLKNVLSLQQSLQAVEQEFGLQ